MPRQDLDYMRDLGQARCSEIVRERFQDRNNWETNSLGCWLWQTSLTTSGNSIGYAGLRRYTNAQLAQQMVSGHSIRNGGANFLLHRVAWVAHHGVNPQTVISHLCSNKNCFNIDHLLDEPQSDNLARVGCLGTLRCPSTDFVILAHCTHHPACLVLPPAGLRCPCSSCLSSGHPSSSRASSLPALSIPAGSPLSQPLMQLSGYQELVLATQLDDKDQDMSESDLADLHEENARRRRSVGPAPSSPPSPVPVLSSVGRARSSPPPPVSVPVSSSAGDSDSVLPVPVSSSADSDPVLPVRPRRRRSQITSSSSDAAPAPRRHRSESFVVPDDDDFIE